jgi:quercetin dioxygenase-like cupin family protein
MKPMKGMAGAALLAGSGVALRAASVPQPGCRRTALLQHDLSSVPGREVAQLRIDMEPGAVTPKHAHPGDEVAYVLEGTLEYEIEGEPAVTLQPGDALFIPAGANHVARNVGAGRASSLATYLVRKGRPLLMIAKIQQ